MKNNYFKHLFTLLLLLCATVTSAHDFEKNGICYRIISEIEKTVAVTYQGSSYDEYSNEYTGDVVIPAMVDFNMTTYKVVGVDNLAFSGCSEITKVVMDNGIKVLGQSAFGGCSNLIDVVLPETLESISTHVFDGCTNLENVIIPNSVTSIGRYAFQNCKSLKNIKIGSGVKSLGEYIFNHCDSIDCLEIDCETIESRSLACYDNKECIHINKFTIGENTKIIKEAAFLDVRIKELYIQDGTDVLQCAGSVGDLRFYDGTFHFTELEYLYLGRNYSILQSSISVHPPFQLIKTLKTIDISECVTEIMPAAFSGCSALANVTIPNSVTSIGGYAFSGCTNLVSIEIPDSVTNIGSYAFNGCYGLTSIEIPNSVTNIGSYAFGGCSSLTSIEIPNSVTSIEEGAFNYCRALKSVVIGNGVKSIASSAFNYCTALENVYITDLVAWCKIEFEDVYSTPMQYAKKLLLNDTVISGKIIIPDDVTTIPYFAFKNCNQITEIVMHNNVQSVGNGAFEGCTGLKEVHINDLAAWCRIDFGNENSNPLYYAHNLYLNGELITDLVVPDGVAEIKNNAFYGCSHLASVTIPNSVAGIGSRAFQNCAALTSFAIGNNVTGIGSFAFYGCNELKEVHINDFATWCGIGFSNSQSNPLYYAKNLYLNGELVTKFVIPDGVTEIKDYTFYNCSSVVSLEIPKSVTNVKYQAFIGCSALKEVYISDLAAWCGINFISTVPGAYNLYLNGELLTDLVIPEGITEIKNNSFYNCTSLKSVVISDSVTKIGTYAFNGCSGIVDVKIGDSVTSIGHDAFNGCTGLTSIVIPNSVTSIEGGAFYLCKNLRTVFNLSDLIFTKGSTGNGYIVYYAYRVITDNDDVQNGFVFSTGDDGCTLVAYLGNETISSLPSDYNGENYAIGDAAFRDCKNIVGNLSIPESVTAIRDNAFNGCTGLTGVIIPDSVTVIGNYAFNGCTGLTGGLVIPKNVTTIGSNAFNGCSGLTGSLVIPVMVTSIGSRAFYNCSGFTSVVFSNGMTTIAKDVFYGCTKLKTVVNFSDLVFNKYNSSYGYISYYADRVFNIPNGSIEDDFIFDIPDGVNTLLGCLGDETELVLPADYRDERYVIAAEAFKGKELTSVEIPNGVTSIGNSAFEKCESLTNVVIGDGVTNIGDYAFSSCPSLTNVVIGNSVTSIGNRAFEYCTGLTSITIPNSVTSIGNYAFSYCRGLTSIEIPNSVTSIGNNAFYNCSGLTSVVIGDGVESIGDYVFSFCSGLTSVAVGNNVKSIGRDAFAYCSRLKVYISDLAGWCGIDFGGDTSNPLRYADDLYLNGELVTELVIPEDVKEIKDYAFYRCSGLTSVTIPHCVTSIERNAFYGCSGLTSVTSLIPAEELFAIDSFVFYNVKYRSCILYVPYGAKETYATTKYWNKFTNIIELEPGDDETTDIDEMKELRAESKEVYYDLGGRAVENPTKGINILNGKKVLVK